MEGQFIYKQRLTVAGWIGAILIVVCPIALGMMIEAIATADRWSPRPEPVLMIMAGVGAMIAPILLLIGREYYRVIIPAKDDAESDDLPDLTPPGVFYPGQPVGR